MFKVLKQLHLLLTREQRRRYILLQMLFGVTALIQVAGVTSLAPFIALLTNPHMIHKNRVTSYLYETFGFTDNVTFLMIFAGLIIAFIIVSNAIAATAMWCTAAFAQYIGLELQNSLYKGYLHRDYVYFSKNNSSRMIAMITQEAPRFVYMVLQPLLSLFSQLFVVTIIVCGLIYIDPALATVALVIVGGGYVGIFRTIKLKLTLHGDRIYKANSRKLRLLAESLGGIKEVKLLGTEKTYEKAVAEANSITIRSSITTELLGDLPRFIIETIAFCALLCLAMYLLQKHGESEKIVSILSLYAMAGYKLLPAAQTIFKSASQIKANGGVLDGLYPAVIEGRSAENASVDVPPLPLHQDTDIHLVDVSYVYPGADTFALKNINLTIRKNTIVALVGPSGAGKSTLADVVLGFLPPTTGRVQVGDIEITQEKAKAWQRHLGYVPQNIFLIDDTITANITFGSADRAIDPEKVKNAAALANIDQFIEGLPGQYAFVVGERGSLLSGGQRQRIGIARALYHDANVLVLDEATSALDNLTEKEIIATITRLKASKTIVMIAHRLSTIKNADQIVYFENGSIEDMGTFDELSRRNPKFRLLTQATVDTLGDEREAENTGIRATLESGS